MNLKNHDVFLQIGALLNTCRECEHNIKSPGYKNKLELYKKQCLQCDVLKRMQALGRKVDGLDEQRDNGRFKQQSRKAE